MSVQEVIPTQLNRAALEDAAARVIATAPSALSAVGPWCFAPAGEPEVKVHGGAGADAGQVRYAMSPSTFHRLLCGQEHELEAVLTGRIAATGPTHLVLATMRALPDVGAAYSAIVGARDFPNQPINTLRSLRAVDLSARRDFPDRLTDAPNDQALFVALVLAGLPTACRAVQTSHLCHALAALPGGAARMVGLVVELADLVAGASNRGGAARCGQLQY